MYRRHREQARSHRFLGHSRDLRLVAIPVFIGHFVDLVLALLVVTTPLYYWLANRDTAYRRHQSAVGLVPAR